MYLRNGGKRNSKVISIFLIRWITW